jgi:hypothetical protein
VEPPSAGASGSGARRALTRQLRRQSHKSGEAADSEAGRTTSRQRDSVLTIHRRRVGDAIATPSSSGGAGTSAAADRHRQAAGGGGDAGAHISGAVRAVDRVELWPATSRHGDKPVLQRHEHKQYVEET